MGSNIKVRITDLIARAYVIRAFCLEQPLQKVALQRGQIHVRFSRPLLLKRNSLGRRDGGQRPREGEYAAGMDDTG
jgi:hypothetical protein